MAHHFAYKQTPLTPKKKISLNHSLSLSDSKVPTGYHLHHHCLIARPQTLIHHPYIHILGPPGLSFCTPTFHIADSNPVIFILNPNAYDLVLILWYKINGC